MHIKKGPFIGNCELVLTELWASTYDTFKHADSFMTSCQVLMQFAFLSNVTFVPGLHHIALCATEPSVAAKYSQ